MCRKRKRKRKKRRPRKLGATFAIDRKYDARQTKNKIKAPKLWNIYMTNCLTLINAIPWLVSHFFCQSFICQSYVCDFVIFISCYENRYVCVCVCIGRNGKGKSMPSPLSMRLNSPAGERKIAGHQKLVIFSMIKSIKLYAQVFLRFTICVLSLSLFLSVYQLLCIHIWIICIFSESTFEAKRIKNRWENWRKLNWFISFHKRNQIAANRSVWSSVYLMNRYMYL